MAPPRVFFAAALLVPRLSAAADFVLTPLLGDSTVTAKQKLAVHQLMASELDFAPEVDALRDLPTAPPTLNDACLASAKCLGAIATANQSTALISGKMSASGSQYVLDLVYYQAGAIVRRQTYKTPQEPTDLANEMTPIIRSILTGDSPLGEASNSPGLDDFADDEEIAIATGPAAPATGKKPGTKPAPRPVPPPPPPPIDEEEEEEVASRIQFGGPAAPPANDLSPEEIRAMEEGKIIRTKVKGTPSPGAAPSTARRVSTGTNERHAAFTARGGYSSYGVFDFATVGGEVSVKLVDFLEVVAGVEAFAVRRTPPEALVLAEGVVAKWDFIYPMNVGLVYRVPIDAITPYVGADFVGVRYYHDEIGSDWAGGGRLRGGVDWMATQNFGLNVNLAVGAWTGKNWGLIEEGLKTTGFLPQISAGTVLQF